MKIVNRNIYFYFFYVSCYNCFLCTKITLISYFYSMSKLYTRLVYLDLNHSPLTRTLTKINSFGKFYHIYVKRLLDFVVCAFTSSNGFNYFLPIYWIYIIFQQIQTPYRLQWIVHTFTHIHNYTLNVTLLYS